MDFSNSGGVIFNALIADFIWSQLGFGLLPKLLLFPAYQPAPFSIIVKNVFPVMTAGFIDMLYWKPDPEMMQSAFPSFIVFIGTLIARSLLFTVGPLTWWVTKAVCHCSWSNLSATITLGLVIGIFYRYYPSTLRAAFDTVSGAIITWLFRLLTTTTYYTFSLPNRAYRHTTALISSLNTTLWVHLTSQSPFHYSSAPFSPTTQIRLLKLHRKFPLLQLSASLLSYPVSQAPPYHAISYVWAHGPQDTRQIFLNGKPFPVRGNVHDILLNCSSFYGPRYVWIDTICIDQSNPSEKTSQVRAMQGIYARASHVLICLGGGWSLPALQLIRELQTIQKSWGQEAFIGYVAAFRDRWALEPYLRSCVTGLLEIMLHPWFERVWVVQEAVVAREVSFFYGGTRISWEELYGWQKTLLDGPVFSTLVSFAPALREEGLGEVMPGFMGFLSMSFIVAYRMEYSLLGANRLSYVLRVFGDKNAKEGLDKVFALVGMTAESKERRLLGLIDYSDRPKEDVMLNVANYLVETGQTLEVLDLGGLRQPGRIRNLPSWAVDWTAIRVGMPLNSTFSPAEIQYHASKNKTPRVQQGNSKRELLVDGEKIDRIAWLAPLPKRTSLTDFSTALLLGHYLADALALAKKHIPSPYPHSHPPQALEESVWRTLIGDKTHASRPAPLSCGQTVKVMSSLLRDLDRMGYANVTKMITGGSASEIQKRFGATKERQEELRRAVEEFNQLEFLFDFGKASVTFMFCVTEGGYMGMVPDGSEKGDVVCLVYGVKVPCVLREVEERKDEVKGEEGGKCQLVGDAYVHGIMDGEALGRGTPETFVLV